MDTWIVTMTEQRIVDGEAAPAADAEVVTLRAEADDRGTAEGLARLSYRQGKGHEGIVLSSRTLPRDDDAE